MNPLLQKTTILFLAVVVFVGGWGCPPQSQASSMISFSASPSTLPYLLSRIGGSSWQDIPQSLWAEERVTGHPDSSGRASGTKGSGTGSLPLMYSPEVPPFHYFGLSKTNLPVHAAHSEPNHFLPRLEVTPQTYALETAGNSSLIPNPQLLNGSPWEVNFILNSLAMISDLPTIGPSLNEVHAFEVLPKGFSTLFLIGGLDVFEGPGEVYNSINGDGFAFIRNLLGLSNRTHMLTENQAPKPYTMFLLGVGLVGLIRYRLNKANA